MGMFDTRAQALGVKPKVLVARTKRSLDSCREQLSKVAAPWADIDNSVEAALKDLLDAFDRFEQHIRSSVTWLNEEAAQ